MSGSTFILLFICALLLVAVLVPIVSGRDWIRQVASGSLNLSRLSVVLVVAAETLTWFGVILVIDFAFLLFFGVVAQAGAHGAMTSLGQRVEPSVTLWAWVAMFVVIGAQSLLGWWLHKLTRQIVAWYVGQKIERYTKLNLG